MNNKELSGRQNIESGKIFAANGPFAHAVSVPSAGRLIYTSTVAALDKDWHVIGAGDMERQIEATINNLEHVLKAAGAGLEDIIKVNWYLTDMDYFSKLLEVRARMFKGNEPASATIPIPALATISGQPPLLIEADAIAWLPHDYLVDLI